MPEGDSIYKLARKLRPALLDQTLTTLTFRGRRSEPVPQAPVVTAIHSMGKHLLVTLDGRRVLRVHLGLKGAVRRLGDGESAPSPRILSAQLYTDQQRIVVVRARAVELFGKGLLASHPVLSQLGPDLLGDPIDWDEIAARSECAALREPPETISDHLLDQRIAAGLGNVYRNELLFDFRIHPDTLARDVPVDQRLALFREGARQLAFNLDPGPRVTTRDEAGRAQPGLPRHRVYRRSGEPCLRCHRPIRSGASHRDARPSFFCPRCQPPPDRPGRDNFR